jgi:methyl-accepting chemotaxis protein
VTLLFGPQAGFRIKILLPPVLILVFLISALSVVSNSWLRDVSRKLARSAAEARAGDLAASQPLVEALRAGDDAAIGPLLNQAVASDPDTLFALVRQGDFSLVGARTGGEGDELKRLLMDRQRVSGLSPDTPQNLVGNEVMVVRKAIPGLSTAEVMVGATLRTQTSEYRSALYIVLTLLGGALIAYVVAALVLIGSMGRRTDELVDAAQRLENGDLKVRITALMPEELTLVGRAFDAAAERLSHAVTHIATAARTVERSAADVGDAKNTLQRGINTQVRDVDEALQSVRDIMNALTTVVRQAESARDDVRTAANTGTRLTNTTQETTTTVEEAERVVTLANDSIQQVSSATTDIAKHADTLSDTTASTASAMLQMKHSIARVRETAITAASLAEQAGVDAERGTHVLTESMTGIEHIREASRAIGSVTEDLERRVGEIGDVLHLITELTQRTNLLALNASIIAAQAGAEGRGFAVVADEIKDLARRTANSAGSIDTLIQAVAEGAHAARRAAVAGADAVETGATQSSEAARTMTDILSRLRNSAAMAKSIAAATDEQARSSAYVTRSIQEVQSHVNEIASKAVEQTRRAEYLQRQVTRMRELIEALSKTTKEQRDGMVQVTDTLARVTRGMEDLASSQRGHLAEGERVRGMLEVLRRVATSHRDQIAAFDRAVQDLNAQATLLRGELSRVS